MANPTLYYDVLVKPLLTEKSSALQETKNLYTFKVRPTANKSEIKKAVETLFEVKVEQVRTIKMPSKLKRMMGRPGRTTPWKKALVTLRDGDSIDLT